MPYTDSFNRKLNGPYLRPDGRKHLVETKPDGRKTTLSYPKWLMEEHLGRLLEPDETVDHINRDFTDDRLTNLRVVPRGQHVKEDVRRVKPIAIICIWCGREGQQEARDLEHNAKNGKAGPFCSKPCVGEYGAYLQNGGTRLRRVISPTREYYYLTKPE